MTDALREALERCRDKFAEYVELHRAKTEGALSIPMRAAVDEKVARNQAMVDLCNEALSAPLVVGADVEMVTKAIREEQVRQLREGEREKCPAGIPFYEEEVAPFQLAKVAIEAMSLAKRNADTEL